MTRNEQLDALRSVLQHMKERDALRKLLKDKRFGRAKAIEECRRSLEKRYVETRSTPRYEEGIIVENMTKEEWQAVDNDKTLLMIRIVKIAVVIILGVMMLSCLVASFFLLQSRLGAINQMYQKVLCYIAHSIFSLAIVSLYVYLTVILY